MYSAGWLKHVMAWRGWHAMGRMSLSVLMVHWCINVNIAASRLQPTTVSLLSVVRHHNYTNMSQVKSSKGRERLMNMISLSVSLLVKLV